MVAAGSDVVVILGAALTLMVRDCVSLTPFASVTSTVKVWVVAEAPTEPLIVPVDGLIERPVGSEPEEIDHANGAVPPVMATGCE